MKSDVCVPPVHDDNTSNGPDGPQNENQDESYFIAKVIHSFDAQAEGELSLSVDDYVVVRQVLDKNIDSGIVVANDNFCHAIQYISFEVHSTMLTSFSFSNLTSRI
ncbi:hypothetical protein U1Q18_002953 [Sarracenia purpurea var. burkii]